MQHEHVERKLMDREAWARRRERGIPTGRQLFVLACMDERIPVEHALGISLGDAHICRNAGGAVTPDVLRSAMISTRLAGSREIIIINHTDCGMLGCDGAKLAVRLADEHGVDIAAAGVPGVSNDPAAVAAWLQGFEDVDAWCRRQIALFEASPLIPDDVTVTGYVWDCENMGLRKPQ